MELKFFLKRYNQNRIFTNCLFLLTTFALFSCISMQSVRKGSFNPSNLSQKKMAPKAIEKEIVKPRFKTDTLEQIQQLQQPISNEIAVTGNLNYSVVSCEDLEFARMKIQKLEEEIYMLRQEISKLLEMIKEDKASDYGEKRTDTKTLANFSNSTQNRKLVKNTKNDNKSTKLTKKESFLPGTLNLKVKDEESDLKGKRSIEEVVSLVKDKRYDDAINLAEKYLSEESDFSIISTLYYWKGEALFYKREFSKALENFQRVLAFYKSPKRIEAQIMIAECYTKQGKLKEAKREYQKFIEEYPFSEFAPRAKRMIQQL